MKRIVAIAVIIAVCCSLLALMATIAGHAQAAAPIAGSDRAVSSVQIVTSSADSGVGSLRAVIAAASAGDIVTFDPLLAGATIMLASEIDIGLNLTISATVPITISGGDSTRLFDITSGTVFMHGLTLIDGRATNADGGIIRIAAGAQLTVARSKLSGGQAERGGAIGSDGSLTIRDTVFQDNRAVNQLGGNGLGGAVYSFDFVNVSGSTFVANSATDDGGALATDDFGQIANSTFSGNTADRGGALFNRRLMIVSSSTFSGDFAITTGDVIYTLEEGSIGGTASMNIANNIVAGGSVRPDCALAGSAFIGFNSHNMVADGTCASGDAAPLSGDPLLQPLGSNGGATPTFALHPSSPARDSGDNASLGTLTFDQRGDGFDRISNGTVDRGAFELQAGCPATAWQAGTKLELDLAIECFNAAVAPAEYTLTLGGIIAIEQMATAINNNGAGISLIVNGGGVDGQNSDRIFDVAAGRITFDNVLLHSANHSGSDCGGFSFGCGGALRVRANAHVVVANSTLRDNQAGSFGGAIDNRGTLTLTNVTLSGNSSGSGGAVYSPNGATLNVENSTFDNNTADFSGGAVSSAGSLTLRSTTLTNNDAGSGGALVLGGTAQLSSNTFSRNSATNTGGTIRNSGVLSATANIIERGDAPDGAGIFNAATGRAHINGGEITLNVANPGSGGAVANSGALTLTGDVLLADNFTLVNGGGIFNEGQLIVRGAQFDNNDAIVDGAGLYDAGTAILSNAEMFEGSAQRGGALFAAGHTTIANSALVANRAFADGGALYISGTVAVLNSTISGNTASSGRGGGLFHAGTLSLTNATIALNGAASGAGIAAIGDGSAVATLGNTIVSSNTLSVRAQAEDIILVDGTIDPFSSQGHNIVGFVDANITAFGASGDQTGILDPRLGPLRDNGGPTPTHSLAPGSPARDAGDNLLAAGLPFDQRGPGYPRIFNGTVDVGALEVQRLCPVFDETAANEGELSDAILCFNAATTPGMYTITLTSDITTLVALPQINNSTPAVALTIDGAGYTLDGNEEFRLFAITGGDVTIRDITIRRGFETAFLCDGFDDPFVCKGGAVYVGAGANVTIAATILTGNRTSTTGGAVHNDGQLQIVAGTLISDNFASDDGGGLMNGSGGVLTVTGPVTLTANHASQCGGGLGNYGEAATLDGVLLVANIASSTGGGICTVENMTVRNSTISDNVANSGDGGGLRSDRGRITIINTTFSDNTAADEGGAIYQRHFSGSGGEGVIHLIDSTLLRNRAGTRDTSTRGGAIHNESGIVIVDNSAIISATAGFGAAISNVDMLTVTNGSVISDAVGGFGGAIHADAGSNTVVVQSTLRANSASLSGGGIFVDDGTLTLSASTLEANGALFGAALFVLGHAARADVIDSTLSGNAAGPQTPGETESGLGGAIYIDNGAILSVSGTTLSNNDGDDAGGALLIGNLQSPQATVINSALSGNSAFNGGAVYNQGTLTLTLSTVSGNSATSRGGGIYTPGATRIERSTISGNTANINGSGIWVEGSLVMDASTVHSNGTAPRALGGTLGGGIYNSSGGITLTNSTISNNSADAGGGLYNRGSLSLTNVTIARNTASGSAGLFNGAGATVNSSNSVIAQNTGPDCSNDDGTIIAIFGNLDSDGTCPDFIQGNALLGLLADNGGPTLTLMPGNGSDAVDAGENSVCAALGNVDQRGFPRSDGNCDLGAVERAAVPTAVGQLAQATAQSATGTFAIAAVVLLAALSGAVYRRRKSAEPGGSAR